MNTEVMPHICLPEPDLSFHPERKSDRDVHPLRGLLRHGPYSRGWVVDPIRVATITPKNESESLFEFMRQLSHAYDPTERKDYLVEWPGFSRVFGLNVRAAEARCRVELPADIEEKLQTLPNPHFDLATALIRAIQQLAARRTAYDIAFIYLPARWAVGFQGGDGEDFDLHDHVKAYAATQGIPIQIVREDKALAYGDRASVMWRIGLAIYAKAGGIPWKLADQENDTAYIGISYAVRSSGSDQPRFVTCCSQVFDAEGAGLEFIAYEAHDVDIRRDNPFLSRTEMFRVMTRSVELYRRRHAGRAPRRVMVHKTTEFKRDEIDGAMEAFELCEMVDLIQVVQNVCWVGARIVRPRPGSAKGQAARYPVQRGTVLPLGHREALIWTHGDVNAISTRGSYFQGARGTPSPLRLVRHAGHGPWDETAGALLALTKMNWNNDALYDSLPVTLRYADVLARVVKRIPTLTRTPYQFRFFM